VYETINDSFLYDTMEKISEEKRVLSEELNKSAVLCQKLLQMVQGQ